MPTNDFFFKYFFIYQDVVDLYHKRREYRMAFLYMFLMTTFDSSYVVNGHFVILLSSHVNGTPSDR